MKPSFRKLAGDQSNERTSSLDEWYKSIQDTPISILHAIILHYPDQSSLFIGPLVPV